jgi:hypothetical protein
MDIWPGSNEKYVKYGETKSISVRSKFQNNNPLTPHLFSVIV